MLINNKSFRDTRFSRLLNIIRSKPIITSFVILLLITSASLLALEYAKKGLGASSKWQVITSFAKHISYKYEVQNLDPLPEIQLDIKFKHFSKISAIRNKLLEEDLTLSNLKGGTEWFPAKIRVGNEKYKAKIRLKGDLYDHRDDPKKWSFKIKIKNGDKVWGMSTFSIQHPKTRQYMADNLLSDIAQENKILSPKMFLVKLNINGSQVGIMNIEESFSKELVESQKRREGILFKADEKDYFGYYHFFNNILKHPSLPVHNVNVGYILDFRKKYLKPYFKSSLLPGDIKNIQYKRLVSLYRSFSKGKLLPSEIFDVKSTAKVFAMVNLFGSNTSHILSIHNERFYFNPISGKIEPAPYDWGFLGAPHTKGEYIVTNAIDRLPYEMYSFVLSDKKIYNQYIIESKRLANSILNGSYDKIINRYQNGYKYLGSELLDFILQTKYHPDNIIEYIYERARWVKENIDDSERKYSELIKSINDAKIDVVIKGSNGISDILSKYNGSILRAYEVKKGGKDFIELVNIMPEDVAVLDVRIDAKGIKSKSLNDIKYPIIVNGSKGNSTPESILIPYAKIDNLSYKIEVYAKFADIKKSKIRKHIAVKYALADSTPFIPKSSIKEQLRKNKFLQKKGEIIFVKSGNWKVNGNIIIPEGYEFKINPGTTLRFNPENMIISHGKVEFVGTKKSPIILTGVNKNQWKGIAVLEADKESIISNVIINNLSGVKHKEWILTGAVNFYKSNIKIKNTTISNNSSEDALNIINSDFDIDNITIKNTYSDGFDCDFCTGTIKNSYFEDIGISGGDAIDISGSDIEVQNTKIIKTSDKAISVGEKSLAKVDSIIVQDALAAFVSKDGSNLRVSNSDANNIKISCFMAYKKKPEYGFATLKVNNTVCKNAANDNKSQIGSSLIIDNVKQENIELDVDELYKTFMRKL